MMTKRYLKVLAVVLIVTAIGIAVLITLDKKAGPLFIEVVSITSDVRQGDEVTLTVKTKPGATVTTSLQSRIYRAWDGPNPFRVARVAGRDGVVSWTWTYAGADASHSDYLPILIFARRDGEGAHTEAMLTFHADCRTFFGPF